MRVAKALAPEFFFTRPNHSRERGLNDHTNDLCQEYFPKGANSPRVTNAEIRTLQDRLNARPRKILRYKTLAEAMFG